MTQKPVFNTVVDIIRDVLDEPSLEISLSSSAETIPNWDSFNHINIVVGIEETYHIKFKTAEIETLRDVGELVALVEKKISAKA